ncbi:uncharacterized protein [Coffea arabica]|uniref:Uncharacterized protein isoform X8 n=1 Tax=Coffea arabica TaxID=13443 RepID=A0ABM4URQ2_COFAR
MATETMAIFTLTSPLLKLLKRSDFVEFQSLHHCVQIYHHASLTKFGNSTTINRCHRYFDGSRESSIHSFSKQYLQHLAKSVSAVRSVTISGLEASIADPEENAVHVKNAKIVVESRDDTKLQVRVDLEGEDTRLVFEKVLTNLARAAPPVPGFRRQKGGKTSKVNIPMTSLYSMKKFLRSQKIFYFKCSVKNVLPTLSYRKLLAQPWLTTQRRKI